MLKIRAVIITGPGFQDEEVVYPYYRFLEEGWSVDVATKDGAAVHGKYGVPARVTMATSKLAAADFDAVVLPGGFEAPDRVRLDKDVLRFVQEMNTAGKLIAAICHGPWILVSARVLRGRRVTGFMSIEDDLRNAGAEYVEAPVVEDGNLITSPHYRDNGAFMKAVVARLSGQR